ncbi:hypothetical protein [[Mycoplasma] mobile]|uniref:Expressed protein n=1 Tax=Mycoplasma mobile (strain ATCC 43663 / 163K / NCTC 11711) TaxID=267748 RepID=Q6KH47_MYCM1|nr:hypothetical protein [[Mycoplasma] mobile]AAT28084.1 expressed protein [Mycoplasma mobile 163K]
MNDEKKKGLIINFSNYESEKIDVLIDKHKVEKNNWTLLSSFKGEKKRFENKLEHYYLPWGYHSSITFNNAIWLYRMKFKENLAHVKKIIFINVHEEIKKFLEETEQEIIVDETKKFLIKIEKEIESEKFYIIIESEDNKLINKIMSYSAISHFNKSREKFYNNFIIGWLFEMRKIFKKTNYSLAYEYAYKFFTEEKIKKNFEEKRKFIYSNQKSNKDNLKSINLGNEGRIYLNLNLNKLTKKSNLSSMKNKKDSSEKQFAYEEMINHEKDLKICASDDQNLKKNLSIQYEDIVYPTNTLKFSDAIHSLRKQYKDKYFIDDNKLENFGKINKIGPIWKIIYNDFGSSFLKMKIFDETEFKKNFYGIIRDNYYLVKNFRNVNSREIIRSMRSYITEKDFEELKKQDPQFKLFYDAVFEESKNNIIYLCHEEIELEKIAEYHSIHICEKNISTLKIRRETEFNNDKEVHYIYDFEKDLSTKCDFNKAEEFLKKIQEDTPLENLENHFETSENLVKENESKKWIIIK